MIGVYLYIGTALEQTAPPKRRLRFTFGSRFIWGPPRSLQLWGPPRMKRFDRPDGRRTAAAFLIPSVKGRGSSGGCLFQAANVKNLFAIQWLNLRFAHSYDCQGLSDSIEHLRRVAWLLAKVSRVLFNDRSDITLRSLYRGISDLRAIFVSSSNFIFISKKRSHRHGRRCRGSGK